MAETQQNRLDRELLELLNELRVALPGVQVLFAFILAIPFTQRFSDVTAGQRAALFLALCCATVSTILLIAPSSHHRLQFRQRDKENLVRTSHRLAAAGLGFLAIAMSAVVYLIVDVLYRKPLSVIVTVIAAALFVSIWYAVPLARNIRNREGSK